MSSEKKGFFQITSLAILTYPLSFFNQMLLSYFYGTSKELDGYYLAFSLVNFLGFYAVPLQDVIVSSYYDKKGKAGKEKARADFSASVNGVLLLLIATAILAWFFAEPLWLAFAGEEQGFDAASAFLLVALLPLLFFFPATNTLNLVLTAERRYFFQNVGKPLGVIVTLVCVGALAAKFGIIALIWGTVLSLLLLFLIQLRELKKVGFGYLVGAKPKITSEFLKLSGVMLVGHSAGMLYSLFEKWAFVRAGEGIVSGYQYAMNLGQIPHNIFAVAVIGVLWPKVIKEAEQKNLIELYCGTERYGRKLALMMAAVALLCLVWGERAVYLLYYRGAFDQASLERTAFCLESIAFLLIPFALSSLWSRSLVALKAGRGVMVGSIGGALAGSAFLYIGLTSGNLRLLTLHGAAATGLQAVLSLAWLNHITGNKPWAMWALDQGLWLAKLGLVLGTTGFLAWQFPLNETEKWRLTLELAWRSFALFAVFFSLAALVGLITKTELNAWGALVKGKLQKQA